MTWTIPKLAAIGRRVRMIRLAAQGAGEIARMAREDTLDRDMSFMAAKGAERYLGALATGDVASEDEEAVRRATCAACPSKTESLVEGSDGPSTWCGPALIDRGDEPDPTCGCLLRLKVLVGSEKCPQGKW